MKGFTLSGFAQYTEGCGTLKKTGGDLGGGSETLIVYDTHTHTHTHTRYESISIQGTGGCAGGGKGYLGSEELAFTLSTSSDQNIMQEIEQPVVYNLAQITHPVNGSNPKSGDPAGTLPKGGQVPVVVESTFGIQANIIDRTEKSGSNGLGVKEEEAPTLTKGDIHAVVTKRRVRRLTPTEFARLQGFPDEHTKIKGATDAQQYSVYGNSMTVNVMRWLGKRIKAVDDILLEL